MGGKRIQPPKSQQTLLSPPADPNTLFRSNSLASKSLEQFMKVSGQRPAGTWWQLSPGPLPKAHWDPRAWLPSGGTGWLSWGASGGGLASP